MSPGFVPLSLMNYTISHTHMHACVCVWHESGGYACQCGVYAAGKSLCSIKTTKKDFWNVSVKVLKTQTGTLSVFIYVLVLELSTAGKWHNDICWKKPEDKKNSEFFVIKYYRIATKKGISLQPAKVIHVFNRVLRSPAGNLERYAVCLL